MSIEIIRKSASGKTVLFGTQEGRVINSVDTLYGKGNDKGGRYLVEFLPVAKVIGGETFMVPKKQYFDNIHDAMAFFRFQAKHELFVAAKEAGLSDHHAEMVTEGKMTLDEALGGMDTDAECLAMVPSHFAYEEENQDVNEYGCPNDPEDDGFDPDLHGGEDDNTPPLEVLMAGGWSAWEWQNEKNAWLDNRMY